MRVSNAGVLLAAVLSTGHALRISDHVANYTAALLEDKGGLVNIAGESPPPLPSRPAPRLPPPVPPRPLPKPPKEPILELYEDASDEVWEQAKCKGGNFVRAMHGSDPEAGQIFNPPRESAASPFEFLDFDAALEWGWDFSDKMMAGDFKDWGIDNVLRDLGSSDKCLGWGGYLDCLAFVHGFKLGADGDWEADTTPYKQGDKWYRRSGAHYGLGFDPQKGVIVAMDRESPQSAGKKLDPPMANDELPAIKSSSDIMWLYWKMHNNPTNLNYFLSTCILNKESQVIISRAIREIFPWAETFPAWGGYDFDTDTPEGQALLGTPNALAFSYLLIQHKATLGNLYISQVRVFRNYKLGSLAPTLLFVVEPVPANDDTQPSEKLYEDIPSLFKKLKQPGYVADTVHAAAKSPADLRPPLPFVVTPKPVQDIFSKDPSTYLDLYTNANDEDWNKAQCKGANFVKAMRGSDNEAGKIFNPPRDSAAGLYNENNLEDLSKWGWVGRESTGPDMRYHGVDHVLRDIGSSDTLISAGCDIRLLEFVHGVPEQDSNGVWQTVGEETYRVNGRDYRFTGAWYKFGIDEENGVIFGIDRMSPQEMGKDLEPPIAGDDLPLIRAFSDMAWMSWASLADETDTAIENIRYFMSLGISNTFTQRILSRCIREVLPNAWGFPAWPGWEFESSSTQGQAILGTPNAQAFSYFLLQHKKELGNLYISKVRVFHDSNWIAKANLLLIVEPAPEGGENEEADEASEDPALERQMNVQTNSTSTTHFLRLWWSRAKL